MPKIIVNNGYTEPTLESCRALALAILHQALTDLISEDETDDGLVISGEARRWFFMVNGNFPIICHVAGIEPMAMRKRAREIETNPELLRNPHV